MKQRVIICGYPKSGNTWLTRLTAEILNCPVTGFWCEPFNQEAAIEGSNRNSDFQCFKAHHTFEQLQHTLNIYGNGSEKIIYVYRDPRAVAVSASHYFSIPKHRRIRSFMAALPKGLGWYHKLFHRPSYSLDCIVKGMIHGTSEGSWLNEPWLKHVKGYANRPDVLSLSYELLKKDPLLAARQISGFLLVDRSDSELEEAIHAQSFEQKKKQFESEGKACKANFLRKGESKAWKKELPHHHIRYIEQNAGELMTDLGYQLISKFDRVAE